MNRRGFVLISVLWVLLVLSAAAAVATESMQASVTAARNRIILRQAEWARNGCEAIVLADTTAPAHGADIGRIDLGETLWCRATFVDPRSWIDLNTATPGQLRRLLGSDSAAAALGDWIDPDDHQQPAGAESRWYREQRRPGPRNGSLAAVEELHLVRGLENFGIGSLTGVAGVGGDGRINLMTAARPVLESVPGLTPTAVEELLRARSFQSPIRTIEQLLARLSPPARVELLQQFARFSQVAAWEMGRVFVSVTGGTQFAQPVAESRLTLVYQAGRRILVAREEP